MTGLIRRRLRCRDRDRGLATVEMVGYMSLVIGCVILGVQLVVWGLAAYGARLAADHAAQAARVYGGSAAAGTAQADLMLDSAAGRGLRDPQVSVTRTATTVTVRISGHAYPVIPGLDPTVNVTMSVPVERAS